MLEISVIVEATELVNAINNLAAALGGAKLPMPAQAAPQPAPQPTAAPTPAPAAAPTPAPAPATPVANVPVAQAPQYTVAQIMEAGSGLMDAGKADDLIRLLHSFGVQAVTELKQEQLGPFATAMRGLGAKI